jgi:hypothetical protein
MRLHDFSPRVGMSAVACMLALLLFAPRSHAQAPVLSKITPPASGSPGDLVTITGEKFGPTKGHSSVTFSGVAATINRWSQNIIIVTVPQNLPVGSAEVVLTINQGKIDQDREDYPGVFTVTAVNHVHPDHGAVNDFVSIDDKNFGTSKGTVKFGDTVAKTFKRWSNAQIIVQVPDPGTGSGHSLNVTVNVGGTVKKEGVFTLTGDDAAKPVTPLAAPIPVEPQKQTPDQSSLSAGTTTTVISAITPSSGVAGTPVTITGTGFGKIQGTVTIGRQKADFAKGGWKDTEIDVTAPDLKVTADTDEPVVIMNESGKSIATDTFKETLPLSPVITSITPFEGVAGAQVTINGRGFGDLQGKSTVTIGNLPATVAATKGWSDSQIVVTAPDLSQSKDLDGEDCSEVTSPMSGQPYVRDKLICIKAPVLVSVADTDNKLPAKVASYTFVETPPQWIETPPQWSDKDEKPGSVRFVAGYEQGYQSAQPSASDAFLAVYGRSLFLKDRFGPFYQIRLQTAPQASGTDGVVSVLTNPSGAVTTQNLQTIGSAVDIALGLEYQIHPWSHHGQTSLGFIAGGGFVTPLQVNSVNASYSMPAFGTLECTELQSRLSSVLSNPVYAGIKANTTAVGSSPYPCFTNNNNSGSGVSINFLEYAAPNQPNFFPKYFAGVRLVNRYAGVTGLKLCDDNNPCERGYIDFTLGQDASITGGSFRHLVATVDTIYPLPVPSINFLYIFGSLSERLHKLPSSQTPLVLQLPAATGPNSPPPTPNAQILVLPLTQPDRDFYRFGIGVSLNQIFTALTKPKTASGSQ